MDKEFAEFIEKEELNIEAAFVEEFGLDERAMYSIRNTKTGQTYASGKYKDDKN